MEVVSGEPVCSLNQNQIELLQNLIRQFKTLGKRFSESKIPELIEKHVKNQPQATTNIGAPTDISNTSSEQPNQVNSSPTEKKQIDTIPPPPTTVGDVKPTLPPLSWQCFHSLLLYGLARMPPIETCISCSSSVSRPILILVLS
jgi:hypothetical protein